MKHNLLTLCLAISCFFAFAQSKNSANLNTNTKSIYSSVPSPIISSSAAAAPPFGQMIFQMLLNGLWMI